MLWGRFIALHIAGQLLAGHRTAREFVRLARRAGDTGHRLVGERLVGDNAWGFGRLASARRHLERAVALYDPVAHRSLALDYVYDQRVVARGLLACTLFVLGYPEQAEAQVRLAVAEAEALRHRASLAHALAFAGMLAQLRDDAAGVLGPAAAVRRLAEEQAIPFWAGLAAVLEGWAMGREGSPEAGAVAILRGLDALLWIGTQLFRPYHLALLADVEGRAGVCDAASARLSEALREAEERVEWWYGPNSTGSAASSPCGRAATRPPPSPPSGPPSGLRGVRPPGRGSCARRCPSPACGPTGVSAGRRTSCSP